MGIPLSEWFACLHVREGGFYGWDTSGSYRNASIQNYLKGIRVITDAGGWVVRLGDPSMTPLPTLQRVIDYAHTRFKSELMDLYLIKECRVFVGMNSGPFDIANLFRKPAVLVNLTEWALTFPMRKGDLAIIKHFFSRSRKRFLSLNEMLGEPFETQCSFLTDEYTLFENSADEISDVIEEFLSKQGRYEFASLQEAFNRGRRRQVHRWLDQGGPLWRESCVAAEAIARYRFAARADSSAGSLGQKYLEQNWLEDRMNSN
jgi:putative glycosyltransferase (TIGR04372 family)